MIDLKRLILLFFLLSVFGIGGRAQITGAVYDARTGDSIEGASVSYQEHRVAVRCNERGQFSISRNEGWKLTFSAVGYQSRTVMVDEHTPARLTVRLKQTMHRLNEVVVRSKKRRYSRKDNPAVELMRRVIAAKRYNALTNHDYYSYDKYQKITFAANDINPEQLDSGRFKKSKWLLNYMEVCPYNNKMILPISIDETASREIYRKDPKSKKTLVLGTRTQGLNNLLQTGEILDVILKDVFTDVNIYDDQIRLLRYPFTSPIGRDAISFYRFYIEDTVYVDKEKCYHLQFIPNNQQDFGFRGELYILADSTLHVKRCNLTIPKKSDVNYVENIKVTQEYKHLPSGDWVLSVDDMMVELSVADFLTKAIVLRTTRMDNYDFKALPDKMFKGLAERIEAPDVDAKDSTFWNRHRAVQLTEGERKMGAFIHRVKQVKGFSWILLGIKTLAENFIETGSEEHPSKVDIGPVNTMITKNFIDGWRTRVSALTTANLNRHLFLSGYYAHAWGSKKNYYKGEFTYSFNEKKYLPTEFPRRNITFTSTYDVMAPSDKFIETDKDNVFTAMKWAKVDKMQFYNRQQLTFEREEDWGFRTVMSLKTEEIEACGNFSFPKLRTTEARLELGYNPTVTFINTKQRRMSVNREAVDMSISHTMGIQGFLGGDYTFNFTEARFFKRFWLNSWGRMDCYVRGGVQWNKVPYPLLIMPAANLSYILQRGTFNLINNMEFMNDRYMSLDLGWSLNGKLFNRIPLIKHLKWREFIGVKCLWGGLSDKNNPTLAANAGDQVVIPFPEGSYVMDSKRPYWEMSFGIYNIFKLLRIEYVRRLNYLNLPTAHKQGLRIMVTIQF